MNGLDESRRRWLGALSIVNSTIAVVCLLALSGTTWWHTMRVASDDEPPTVMHDAGFLVDTAHPGDTITLWVDRTRARACPGQVYEWWRSGQLFVQGPVSPAGASLEVGRARTEFEKAVPMAIRRPGRWCYEPMIVYECAYRRHTVRQPQACLDVVLSSRAGRPP